MNHLDHLKKNKNVFFNFMHENYTIFQYSNMFLRDMQYAINSYFELKESPVTYSKAEELAVDFIDYLVSNGELTQIDKKSWKINFEVGIKKKAQPEGVENE